MREYLSSLLVMSALLSMASLLAYRENDKTVRVAFSVVFIAALVLPLSGLIGGVTLDGIAFPKPPELSGENECEEVASEALLRGMSELLCSEFSIRSDKLRVEGEDFYFEKMRFGSVCLNLYGSAVFKDLSAIERFIKENFGGCDVKIKLG